MRVSQPRFIPSVQPVDPWRVELIVVAASSHSGGERRELSRDRDRGLLTRIGTGAWVDRAAYESLDEEQRHIVSMRALAATCQVPVVFSHWSAAVLHGLPILRARLASLHVTTTEAAFRHRRGVAPHAFAIVDGDVVTVNGLRATAALRTIVDLAGAAPLDEGVIAADHALRSGVPRRLLEAAIDLAGPRRASRRIVETIAFAHPGSESAAESRMRVNAFRIGVEPPELQHRIRLPGGRHAFLDAYFRRADAGLEVDGDRKYLDPKLAPAGAGAAVVAEKRREDEVRLQVSRLARIGWAQSGDASLLRPILARIGVLPASPLASFDDYCAVARRATPRRPS